MTALAAEGAAAAGGALAATEGGFIAADAAATIAGAGAFDTAAALGMTLDQAITTGLMTEIGTLTDIGAAAIMEGAGIAPEMAASFFDGTISAEAISTAATDVTNAYNTTDDSEWQPAYYTNSRFRNSIGRIRCRHSHRYSSRWCITKHSSCAWCCGQHSSSYHQFPKSSSQVSSH
jgi:hypothetical protein